MLLEDGIIGTDRTERVFEKPTGERTQTSVDREPISRHPVDRCRNPPERSEMNAKRAGSNGSDADRTVLARAGVRYC
ncbi:hypothetical protein C491_14052 [Natronococcus amylolyticus DSM 10524]|uniref:Uncharacterized protein n=1 Tax=Natronococcus amylolyticus DSM 10524 TaxID=1227497 RepID=L9X678_9EURY|nr:hypothetical protein [Natronococcus amylolyticus]ELY56078.1 hypothetical protein C491_14052 [Natronococcus amylolyticus DSM 10524]